MREAREEKKEVISGFKAQNKKTTGLVQGRKKQLPATERRMRRVSDRKEGSAYFFLSLSFLSG